MIELNSPWSPDSQSVKGRKVEKVVARNMGARTHSNSGAGTEKADFSTHEAVYEMKLAKKTHTIKGSDLEIVFKAASSQGKDAMYRIYFEDANLTLEGVIHRGA